MLVTQRGHGLGPETRQAAAMRGRQLDLVEVLAIQIWVFCACRKDRGPLACYSQARAMDVMM